MPGKAAPRRTAGPLVPRAPGAAASAPRPDSPRALEPSGHASGLGRATQADAPPRTGPEPGQAFRCTEPEPAAGRSAAPAAPRRPEAGRASGSTEPPEEAAGQSPESSGPGGSPEPGAGRTTGPLVPGPLSGDGPITGAVVPGSGSEVERRPAGSLASRPASGVEPSWAKVLGNTVALWLARRPVRHRVLGALVAVLVAFAAGGLTVALVRNSGTGRGGSTGSGPASLAPLRAATAARQSAATWIEAQVSHDTVVSCDPAMCAALQAKGFPAGDLMTLGPGTSDPLGSAVVVATAAVRSLFGSRLTTVYGPTVIASFGSGSAQVDVRVYAAGGAAAYLAALRADQASRQSVGSQLLRNSHVSVSAAARQQLASGQVDSRLLITIATLSGQGPVSVAAFTDSGPGASAGAPLREAELATPAGAKSGYLQSVLALLRAQQPPYLASSATLTRLADGQQVVQIVFDAPSPLGLLRG
jgi:hypothetical protein